MDFGRNSRYIWALIWIFVVSKVISQLKVISALSDSRPNIIFVMTDDQDSVLDGMTPMEHTLKLLADEGATFTNAFTPSPMCCPSRASILTGQYAHNHHTINDSASGGCYGETWINGAEKHTFPVHLQKSGYKTFYAGKYMNSYYSKDVPPGYTHFYGLLGNSVYYDYVLNENGVKKKYGHQEQDYLTDVLSTHLEKFLSEQNPDEPFLAIFSPPAPHAPFTPAKRHESAYANVKALRTPNFNIKSEESDKHWLVRMSPAPLPPEIVENIDDIYRKRWQCLLSVDEIVERIVTLLKRKKLYDNTYIAYASDNGFHMGQFALPCDKRQPYETDIRVPFIVTGPGIRTKRVIKHPIAMIDMMPTFLDWAGIAIPEDVDGRSFRSLVNTPSNEHSDYQLLIEHWGEGTTETYSPVCPQWHPSDRLSYCDPVAGCHCEDSWNNTYTCLRRMTPDVNEIYCEFDDTVNFEEAYDLSTDPYQMHNTAFHMSPSERSTYKNDLSKLRNCFGKSCQSSQN